MPKKSKIKCYRVHITEKQGDYEYGCEVIFRTSKDPEEHVDWILKGYRGLRSESVADGAGYLLCGGNIFVSARLPQEISKEDYAVLERNGISRL